MTNEDRCVVLIHVPRTAGTLLRGLLAPQLQSNLFLQPNPRSIKDFFAMPSIERHQLRLITGHMPIGIHRHLDQKVTYVTFLRDPVDRVISAYRHTMSHLDQFPTVQPNETLIEFAKRPGQRNFQVQQFANYLFNEPLWKPTYWWTQWTSLPAHQRDNIFVELLDQAIENVNKTTKKMYSSANLHADMITLFDYLNLQNPSSLPHVNSSSEPLEVSESDKDQILELNRWDEKLIYFFKG